MRRAAPILACAMTALLLGCGGGTSNDARRAPSRLLVELRYAAAQETLTCPAGQAKQRNGRTLRQECVKQSQRELFAAVNRSLDGCHGRELVARDGLVQCVEP